MGGSIYKFQGDLALTLTTPSKINTISKIFLNPTIFVFE